MKNKNKIIITSRDEEILKGVYVAPHTRPQVKEKYFKSGGKITSEAAVSRRLRKLLKNNYIVDKMVDGKVQFCLGEAGAKYLHEKFVYEINDLKLGSENGFLVGRKNINYKRIVITGRDLDVLETLASGPATYEKLAELFIKEDGSPCSRPFISRRLLKLTDFNIIKKVDYKLSNPSTIFYLDKIGAEELVLRRNHDGDSIRMNVVKREEIRHEIMLTEIVREIRREVNEYDYKIVFQYDDHYLRKKYGNKKNVDIPDLYFQIKKDTGEVFTFFVEIDTGTRPAITLVKKLKKYRGIIIIVTSSDKRKNILQKAILETETSQVMKRINISVFSDVIKKGFFKAETWLYMGELKQE